MLSRYLFSLLVVIGSTNLFAQDWQSQKNWAKFFTDAQVQGTIAVLDQRNQSALVYDLKRAQTPFIPASTFKIPHALFALDAGIIKDEFQVLPWDGVKRTFDFWNRDQNLRSSIRQSVVWVYQRFARELGETREREYLKRIDYGNAQPTGGIDQFWLTGGLRISAIEQITFLQKLYRNQLPFRIDHQRLVKDVMINEAQKDYILRAKTGWATDRKTVDLGWWVGWVERPDGVVFFALNIDMPNGLKDAGKRQLIARKILQSISALP